MLTGRVVRFDEVRGYGFIAPDDGGDDVFIHANMLEGDKTALLPGVQVEYEAVDSDRGPKALTVRVTSTGSGRAAPSPVTPDGAVTSGRSRVPEQGPGGLDDEDGLCDVLSERAFLTETTEALLTAIPELTAAQIVEIRLQWLAFARRHGWVEG